MGLPLRRIFVVTVSLYYIYMGICKIAPALNSDLHSEFRSSFAGHARVFPGRIGINIDAEFYRLLFGFAEVVSGVLILVSKPGETVWAVYAVYTLLGLQSFLCLSHYSQGESNKCIPNLVALNFVGILAAGSYATHYKCE